MNAARFLAALVATAAALAAQAGGPLRCAPTAAAGGGVDVDVASNDQSITLLNPATGEATSFPVPPGKRVTVPVPVVPPGTVLVLIVGRGLAMHAAVFEVVSP